MKINITISNQHTGIKAINFIEKDLSIDFIGLNRVNNKLITLEFLDTPICDREPILKAKLNQLVENNHSNIKDLYSYHGIKIRAYSISHHYVVV